MRKIKNIDYLFYALMIGVIEVALFASLNYHKNIEINEIQKSSQTRLNTQINAVLNYYNTTSEIIITQILTDKKNYKLFKNMNSENKNIKSDARQTLYLELLDTYLLLSKYDFRQLHFHDKDGNSFLRFHQKEYFGDNLLKIRPTIQAVHQTKKQVKGFEEGKIVNGFRNVFPIFIDNQFQGTVELSNSFDGISSQLHKNYPFEYKLIIDKKDVNSKLFPELIQKHYKESTISEHFYEEVKQNNRSKYKNISKKEVTRIDEIIKNKKVLELSSKGYVFDIQLANINYIVTVIPMKNFDGSITTYAISYSKNDAIFTAKKELFFSFLFANLFLFTIFVLIKLKQYIQNSDEYAEKAYTDKLTGLLNRQKFEIDYNDFFTKGSSGHNLAVILFDIDFFKKVNDLHGHQVGDEVLKKFALIAKETLRQNDFLYRWGGEEFVVLLFIEDISHATIVAEKIRNEIENTHFEVAGHITGSFGIALQRDNDTPHSLFDRADQNLYCSKNNGRNRITI